jgi:hypothetical protein
MTTAGYVLVEAHQFCWGASTLDIDPTADSVQSRVRSTFVLHGFDALLISTNAAASPRVRGRARP